MKIIEMNEHTTAFSPIERRRIEIRRSIFGHVAEKPGARREL